MSIPFPTPVLRVVARWFAARKPPWLLPLAMGLATTMLFFALAHEAAIEKEHDAQELGWMAVLHTGHSELLTAAMRGVNTVHDPVVAALLSVCITVLVYRRRWRQLWLLLAVVPGGMLLNLLAKHLFHRMRPDIAALVPTHGYAFPSGHVIAASVLAAWAIHLAWRGTPSVFWRCVVTAVATSLVFVVAFSRVYLGAHYPSDVLAGMLEAVAWFCVCLAVDRGIPPMHSGRFAGPLLKGH